MSMQAAPTLAPQIEDDNEPVFQRRLIRSLSKSQRRVLKEHGVGPVPVVVASADYGTTKSLKSRHLIYYDQHKPPRFTQATEAGRAIIAAMLAAEADQLLEHLEP
jgi:hypothetical protein